MKTMIQLRRRAFRSALATSCLAAFSVTAFAQQAPDQTAGPIVTNGPGEDGITINSDGAPAEISFSTVQTDGPSAIGVRGGGTFPVVIDGEAVYTSGDGSTGLLISSGDSVRLTLGQVTTQGSNAGGLVVNTGSGGGSAVIGTAATAGNFSDAVTMTGSGPLSLTAEQVTTNGAGSVAVRMSGGPGPVTAALGNVQTQRENALGVVLTGTGAVTGTGISVLTEGAGATGVIGTGGTGLLDLSFGRVATTGINAGAVRVTTGAGGGNVRLGEVAANGGFADAVAITGGGRLSLVAGQVSTAGDESAAVRMASDSGPASATFDTIRTEGVRSAGVLVQATDAVSISGGSVLTAGPGSAGVMALGNGANVSIQRVTTQGSNAAGVMADGGAGGATVRLGQARTLGDFSDAVIVTGSGPLSLTAEQVTTTGAGSVGVQMSGGAGAVTATLGDVQTQGDRALGAVLNGAGAVTARGNSVLTAGAGATGVIATGGTGLLDLSFGRVVTTGINAGGVQAVGGSGGVRTAVGDVRTAGSFSDGIAANTIGPISLAANSVTTTGEGSLGVRAATESGPISVQFGSIRTTGAGAIGAQATGAGQINVVGGTVSTAGSGATALRVIGGAGLASVDVARATATGTNAGAVWVSAGAGGADVRVGDASVTSAATNAVLVTGPGPLGVRTTGVVSAPGGAGIRVTGTGTASVTTGRSVYGSPVAVEVDAARGSTVNIGGTLASDSGLVLRVSGGSSAVTVASTGTLNDRFQLTDNDDVLTNRGTLVLLGGSTFGGGNDQLVNAGLLRIGGAGTSPVAATVGSLERTVNSGTIDLANGVVGDTLRLPGTYQGESGRLRLDVSAAGAGASDRLIVDGAANGTTIVDLSVTGLNGDPIFDGLQLVQSGGGSGEGAFTLAPGTLTGRFADAVLVYDQDLGGYSLYSAPSRAVVGVSQLAFSARQGIYRSLDSIQQHWADQRIPSTAEGVSTTGVWGSFSGSRDRFDRTTTGSLTAPSTTTDLSLRENVLAGQIGFDFAQSRYGAFGVTGGYSHVSGVDRGTAGRYTIEGLNVGLTAALTAGPAFLNLTGFYNHQWLRTNGNGQFSARFKNSGFGGLAELGARLTAGPVGVTPSASIAYARIGLKDEVIETTRVVFDGQSAWRAAAGFRLDAPIAGVSVFADARVNKQFGEGDRLRLTIAGTDALVESQSLGTYGTAALGVVAPISPRALISATAKGAFGNDYHAIGGSAALTLRF